MHIADLSLDILGCNGIVGAGIPHACGAALTAKLRGTGQVAVAYFGDGAAGQGAVHEGMNLAATWKLPVVFICENNQFALSADWRTQRAVEDIADRAAGYGMPGEVVDGNDVAAVEEAVARALARARAGRRADAARDEDVPPDAALDAREPARRARPARSSRSGRRRTRCRGSRQQLGLDDDGARGGRARRRRARSRRRSRRRSPTRTRARTTCCRPSSPRTAATPQPPAPGERALGFVAAIREALELGARRRPGRDRDRRGHRPRRRPLPRDRGPVRDASAPSGSATRR